MIFSWDIYLKEEKDIEIVNPTNVCIPKIHKVLKGISDITRIDIDKITYGHNYDGRDKVRVSLEMKDDADIPEILEKVLSELSGYDIDIERLSDDERKDIDDKTNHFIKNKSVCFYVYKKFGAEKLSDVKYGEGDHEPKIKIIKIGAPPASM